MNFGKALSALKHDRRVRRAGWNGKGMFVILVPEQKLTKKDSDDIVILNPHFLIQTVNGSLSTWVPSVNDCLAEDWEIL